MSVQLRFAARSDVGAVRKNNQDAGYAGPHLLVLADGMGGAAGGDTASSVTVSKLSELDDIHRADDLLPMLRETVTEAHDELVAMATDDPALKGMGTTCIALMRSGNKLAMVHIGDSRAYLLRGDSLIQVTKDHTLVQYLVDHGQITPEEAENHPKKNVIMRALGDTEGEVELDESVREAVVGDRWLLCSDGLFGVVSNETIAHTLLHYANLEKCVSRLIELALAGGAPDNVTVVLADILDDREISGANAPSQIPVVVGSASAEFESGKSKRPVRTGDVADPNCVEDDEAPKKKKWPARLAVLIGVFVLLAGGIFGAWFWTQSQYYVYSADGNVGIYRGVPQALGPIELSHLDERTDLQIEDLTQTAQRRLEEPVTHSSREDAENYVSDLEDEFLRDQIVENEEQKEADDATEDPTETPSPVDGSNEDPADEPSQTPPPRSDSGGQPTESDTQPEETP
ncbi:Stp1/IreP family PP2C-type Ser/Thr phosphatase [Flaviflexus ciconiae]|uniref:Serine/threonine protein phosphatase PstP n=1 Tax=Flaviflexus ciconiae TaxID=2496867 RepID=A0A3Q9G2P0_9ACTO|nr:Stp1/IreP family PP2C-type Ser/Thr phosphatase [Flaviflexus ciconiae]AZQ77573.1 Stp1/IreP family PP2C-type Ser/Thr phosphatase [Flaviflexus ciconiae]